MGKKETTTESNLTVGDLPERPGEDQPQADPWPWQSRKGPSLGKRLKKKRRHFSPRRDGTRTTRRRHRHELEPDEDF